MARHTTSAWLSDALVGVPKKARFGGLFYFWNSRSSAAEMASMSPSMTTTSPSRSRVSGAGGWC
jgi:hypothetical protein